MSFPARVRGGTLGRDFRGVALDRFRDGNSEDIGGYGMILVDMGGYGWIWEDMGGYWWIG